VDWESKRERVGFSHNDFRGNDIPGGRSGERARQPADHDGHRHGHLLRNAHPAAAAPATAEMLGALKTGDKVITNAGIYGTINGFDGETVILKIAEQVKIRIARSAITQVETTEDAK
jgi:preprotein translocase YajC subunit